MLIGWCYFYFHYVQTFDVFKFICRGYYEKHKYLFTLLLTLNIDLQNEYVSYDEFQVFIKGKFRLNLVSAQYKLLEILLTCHCN